MKSLWTLQLSPILLVVLCPACEASDLTPAQHVRELVKELKSDYWPDRARAASALGDLGPDAAGAALALAAALQDPEELVRYRAARALGRIGAAAYEAAPQLRKALEDPDERVREAAAAALVWIGPSAREVERRAQKAQRRAREEQRRQALLVRRLDDPDIDVRASAAAELGRFDLDEASRGRLALDRLAKEGEPSSKAAAVTALRQMRARKLLCSGELEKSEKALRADLAAFPRADDIRFALGMLQLFRAVEGLGQSLYRYGAQSQNTNIPFLRLPVPKNPQPRPITYADLRRLLDDFRRDLSTAEATLAGISDERVKLPLRLAAIRLDLDGDGKATDGLVPILEKILGQGRPGFLEDNPDFLVCFDRGDVAWLHAYYHLLMGALDFYLAFDTEALFDAGADQLFANPKTGFHGTDEQKQRRAMEVFKEIVIKEPARLGRFRKHLLAMAALNRQTWKHIRAEKDDDHEWLPNARQHGVLGLEVRNDMIDAWLAMMAELEALLDGKRTLPWGSPDADKEKRVSLKALLQDPPEKIDEHFQAHVPRKYLSTEPEVASGVFQTVFRIFFERGLNPFGYAAYFN